VKDKYLARDEELIKKTEEMMNKLSSRQREYMKSLIHAHRIESYGNALDDIITSWEEEDGKEV